MSYFEADLNELPESEGEFSLLPPGWYTAEIEKSELCQTKKGTGEYIKLQFNVTGPTHGGRKLFVNLNVKNESRSAEEIGRRSLGEIMRAIGISRIGDTDDLIGRPMEIKVSSKKNEWQGETKEENVIKNYRATQSAEPSAPSAPAPSSKPLWMK